MIDILEFLKPLIEPVNLSIWSTALFIIVMGAIVWRESSKGKNMVKVRVKRPFVETVYWRKPIPTEKGESIEMFKKNNRRKEPGWRLYFDNECIYPSRNWLGQRVPTIDVFFRALNACSYDFANNIVERPILTQTEAAELNRLDALRERGKGIKMELPGLFWLVLIVSVAVGAISIFLYWRVDGLQGTLNDILKEVVKQQMPGYP